MTKRVEDIRSLPPRSTAPELREGSSDQQGEQTAVVNPLDQEAQATARLADFFGNDMLSSALAGESHDGLGTIIGEEMALSLGGVVSAEASPLSSNQAMLRAMRRVNPTGRNQLAGGDIQTTGGSPLPQAVQAKMEQAFGHSFSHVRIHTDAQAGKQADALNAHAFSLGSHIWFGPGEWAPHSREGERLLAHELTHVVQADEGRIPAAKGPGISVSSPTDATEQEAYANEDRITARIQQQDPASTPVAPSLTAELAPLDSTVSADVGGPDAAVTTEAAGQDVAAPVEGAIQRSVHEDAPSEQPHTESKEMPGAEDEESRERQNTTETEENEERANEPSEEEAAQEAEQEAAEDEEAVEDGAEEAVEEEGLNSEEESEEGEEEGEESAEEAAAAEPGSEEEPTAETEGDSGQPEGSDDGAVANNAPARHAAANASLSGMAGSALNFSRPNLVDYGFGPASQDTPEQAEERRGFNAQLDTDASKSQEMVQSFVQQRGAESQELTTLYTQIATQIDTAAATARAAVHTALNAQKSAVSAQIAAMREQATAVADLQKESISTAFQTSLEQVDHATTNATTQVGTELDAALTHTDGLLSSQQQSIEAAYVVADQLYRQTVIQVAADARTVGTGYADGYGSLRTKVDNTEYSRRAEAWREAALKVVDAYVDGLTEEGNGHADRAQQQKSADLQVAEQAATATREAHNAQASAAREEIAGLDASARAHLEQVHTEMLGQIDQNLAQIVASLDGQEQSALGTLDQAAQQQLSAIDTQAEEGKAGLGDAVAAASEGIANSVQLFLNDLNGQEIPSPAALGPVLAQMDGQYQQQVRSIHEQISGSAQELLSTIQRTGSEATQSLSDIAATAVGQANTFTTTGCDGLQQIGQAGTSGLAQVAGDHVAQVSDTITRTTEAHASTNQGLLDQYTTSNANRQAAVQNNNKALQEGLKGAFPDMRAKCIEEGQKAADAVQPRWKSFLKWVAIIAVVVVCAVVLGPLVLGALPAALGTVGSAIVAGAIVGGVSSAAVQVISNAFDGKPLTEGVLKAAAIGALTGGITGGIGAWITSAATAGTGSLANFATSKLGNFSLGVATDAVFNSIADAAQGKLTWESFFTGIALSAIGNGVKISGPGTRIANRVQNFGASTIGRGNGNFVPQTTTTTDVSAPAQDGVAPVQDGTAPVQDGTAPVQDGTAPVQDGTAPVQDGTTPVQDGTAPVQDGTAPVQDGTTPTQDGTVPAQDGLAQDGQSNTQDGASTEQSAQTQAVDNGDWVDLTGHSGDQILNQHRSGSGNGNEFPASWTDGKILHAISDVATDMNTVNGIGDGDAPYTIGTYDGVEIRVNFYPDNHAQYGGEIASAYPTQPTTTAE